jgi:hypothetical protein
MKTLFYAIASKIDADDNWNVLREEVEKGWIGPIDRVTVDVETFFTAVVEGTINIGPFRSFEEADKQRQPGEGPPRRVVMSMVGYMRRGEWVN